MIYDASRDMHDSMETVLSYAMPNVHAHYTADRIDATAWDGDYPACAACGRSKGPFEVHHEPERSKRSLLLKTSMGQFVVKPALLLLCKGCHLDRSERRLKISWEFDTEEDREAWLSGDLYAHGYQEHDGRMFQHGRIVFERAGRRWSLP